MSSPDVRRAIITLGNAAVALDYAVDLVDWFGTFPPTDSGPRPAVTISIQRGPQPGLYHVGVRSTAGVCPSQAESPETDKQALRESAAAHASFNQTPPDHGTPPLALGDALAAVWEHVCYHVIDAVHDAVALHGAALSCPEGLIVLSGASGSGKTSLALWYQAQGFDLGTDEVVSLQPTQPAEALNAAALSRPVIVKRSEDLLAIPRLHADQPWRTEESAAGIIVRQPAPNTWTKRSSARTLVLFPSFRSGAALSLQPLSPARLGLALMANCVNTRNLPAGGLPWIKAIVAQARGVRLEYGSTAQLTGTMDVFARQVLAGWPDQRELQALCEAFSARVLQRTQGKLPGAHPED